jgi:hypothetical protein
MFRINDSKIGPCIQQVLQGLVRREAFLPVAKEGDKAIE